MNESEDQKKAWLKKERQQAVHAFSYTTVSISDITWKMTCFARTTENKDIVKTNNT